MKKSILLIGLALSMMASAQVLNVSSVQQLQIPTGDVKVAGISHDGSYILLTSGTNEGLSKYVLTTGETEVLSTASGSGYNAQISSDDQSVIFREKTLLANRTFTTSLVRRDLGTRQTNVLVEPTRSARKLSAMSQLQSARPSVSIENQQLVLTIGSTSRVLSPCGTDKSYIWPSVSPDAQHICFYVCGRGLYVSDIAGQHVQFLGKNLRAPKWYNNSVIVAMNDQDNGEYTISSEIVAVNLSGTQQVLTSGINAMYPYACEGKIVCSGFQGETYLITVE